MKEILEICRDCLTYRKTKLLKKNDGLKPDKSFVNKVNFGIHLVDYYGF